MSSRFPIANWINHLEIIDKLIIKRLDEEFLDCIQIEILINLEIIGEEDKNKIYKYIYIYIFKNLIKNL